MSVHLTNLNEIKWETEPATDAIQSTFNDAISEVATDFEAGPLAVEALNNLCKLYATSPVGLSGAWEDPLILKQHAYYGASHLGLSIKEG